MNKQEKQTNKNSQTQTTVWWLPNGREGRGVVKGKGGQTHDERFDFGWWAHYAIYRWCIIDLYS